MDSDIRKNKKNSILYPKNILPKMNLKKNIEEEKIIVRRLVNGKENEMKRKLRSSSRFKNDLLPNIINQTKLKSNLVNKNYDTIIIFHLNEKPKMDASIQCRICNKKLPSCIKKLLEHYKIAHYFTSFQTNNNDVILIGMKEERKYYNYCCLQCFQKFDIFDKLNCHRCKLFKSSKKPPGNNNESSNQKNFQDEPVIDYNSPEEYFHYLGLQKKPASNEF